MAIGRTHPANAFGWLFVDAEAARQAMDAQQAFVDKELAIDKHRSGEPHPMREWAIGQVKRLARHDQKIGEQISQRRATLLRQLERLQADKAQREIAHTKALAAIARDLELLDQVDPAAQTAEVET